MKSLFYSMILVLLSACGTATPVIRQKFPEPPELLMQPVPELKKLEKSS
jgi:hypothetical protein